MVDLDPEEETVRDATDLARERISTDCGKKVQVLRGQPSAAFRLSEARIVHRLIGAAVAVLDGVNQE